MKTRFLLSAVTTAILSVPAVAATPSAPAAIAPLHDLIAPLDIPFETFTLDNGLRVVVHTDRRTPVVAVGVWYDVGSTSEPAGKTGFAHLFEHLMFNGTENVPGDFFAPLKAMGATDYNGTTYFDRTNYYETVPTDALERTLYLESDRMGWLLGAVTQHVLDVQRGVVQNEKRQRDNQPDGLVSYRQVAALYPQGHPYAHDPIGSMKDLDGASLADVKAWFHDHYGPNNAVLVLSGDIDAAAARPLVDKYFGAIARRPQAKATIAPVTPLAKAVTETMTDRVATVMIDRSWPVPGMDSPDSPALDIAAGVLGNLASSRLAEALVRQEKLAVSVTAGNASNAHAGMFDIRVMVRPSVDPAAVTARLDAIMAEFLAHGPTPDEVRRAATDLIVSTTSSLESVSDKAEMLAEGELYSRDPGFYRRQLEQLAAETPERVTEVARRWLAQPAYTLTVTPGTRAAYDETAVSERAPAPETATETAPVKGTRGPLPALGEPGAPKVPAISRARLSNGIEVVYANQPATPFTRVVLSLDAGASADPASAIGTQQLMLAMLTQGTIHRSASAIAEQQENLGASIQTGASLDRTTLVLSAPSANAAAALDLLADVALAPAFPAADLARTRGEQLARIAQEQAAPAAVAARTITPLLYGADSPYARAQGSGDAATVAKLTAADLTAFHKAWFRPEKAQIFVASERPLSEVRALLERSFGGWKAVGPAGTKAFPAARTAPFKPEVVLIDRPDSPQSYIMAGFPTPLDPKGETIAAEMANDALGGDFLSRINMDLREDKHWTYGVRGTFRVSQQAMPYIVTAPVQADRTGDSIVQIRHDMEEFLTSKPLTADELERSAADQIRSLPGAFASSGTVLGTMQRNALLARPDDYEVLMAQRVRALTPDRANAAIRAALDPSKGVWVVVGDAAKVGPQLKSLGLTYRLEATPAPAAKDTAE
ncbi:pitrilysin family protein [Novosphingobium sp. KA1]|uniref:M16 family metallopeptidase n=1 Tax=Novosphingobium sp. (strain KA1) TaxID=164608 RepID=UPI001A8C6B00|nr:pitrilysin family protein [Novosphingobium sp. KA1]QSR20166.1 peptidase M16 [Novosphingobium sp. KA1]